MKNEMTLDQHGLTIPAEELAEHGLDGADLSAQMTRNLIMLMPQRMTAKQMVDALAGLCEAASQLVEVLTAVCMRRASRSATGMTMILTWTRCRTTC